MLFVQQFSKVYQDDWNLFNPSLLAVMTSPVVATVLRCHLHARPYEVKMSTVEGVAGSTGQTDEAEEIEGHY